MKNTVLIFAMSLLIACTCNDKQTKNQDQNSFSFVFMTDIHLQPEQNATEGFLQAIDTINKLSPDFVLTGGDNIMDALGQTFGRSDSLYNLYDSITAKLKMPVHNTLGNHEVFGLYTESGIDESHPDYGKKMYEKRLAERYYSFDYQNWHFIILDAIGFTEDRHYYGHIDSIQIAWLKSELEKIGKDKPIAISTHIPFLSIGAQVFENPTQGMNRGSIVTNSNDIIKIIEPYNVKLVLQGHLHFLEDIYYNGTHYITGGAVSSKWWQGKRNGLEEGFLLITIDGEEFKWEYIDYGWVVENQKVAA